MMIDKIGGLNPLNNMQNSHRVANKSSVSAGFDSISVSKEAQEMAEIYFLSEVAKETPDVRMDVIEQVRLKIQDPSYLNDAIIESTAERFMDSYFG